MSQNKFVDTNSQKYHSNNLNIGNTLSPTNALTKAETPKAQEIDNASAVKNNTQEDSNGKSIDNYNFGKVLGISF